MSKRAKITIRVIACLDQSAGNDSKSLGLAFHQGSTFINAYWQAGLSKQTFISPGFLLVKLISLHTVCNNDLPRRKEVSALQVRV